jgi:hypothetical protein
MIRLTLGRKMDVNRMFAVWRVDPPWQPVTKKVKCTRELIFWYFHQLGKHNVIGAAIFIHTFMILSLS